MVERKFLGQLMRIVYAQEHKTFPSNCKLHPIQKFGYIAVPNAVECTSSSGAVSAAYGDSAGNIPVVRKKERDYEGMFEFRKEDITVIIRHLVIGESPVSYTRASSSLHLYTFEFQT